MNAPHRTPLVQFLHRVQRSCRDRRLGGVCGGIGAVTDIPSWVYRALFVALAPFVVGIVAYAALWICMPEEPLVMGAPRAESTAAPVTAT